MRNLVLLMLFVSAYLPNLTANNIAVANVSLTDQVVASHYCNVKFDLSWENSWRNSTIPNNWDAAWVFVKYRVSGGEWHHAALSSSSGDHIPATGSVITAVQDGMGVYIYRSANGSGTNTWTNIKLRWNYGMDGIADDASLEVKVLAIEMVYIPQGSFYLGDGNGSNESTYAFHTPSADNTAVLISASPVVVKTDVNAYDDNYPKYASGCSLTIDGDGGIITAGGATPQNNPNFPTGYNAFYIMKYETSQEQFMDFVNMLNRSQQNNRLAADISGSAPSQPFVMSNSAATMNRNGVRCPASIAGTAPVTLFCDYNNNVVGNEAGDGQNIAVNFVNWSDLAAYSDWAGLRPMTELELEKAARGPNASVTNEFAWGNANLAVTPYTISNTGMATEVFSNPGTGTGNAAIFNLYAAGPVRCGVFAASAVNKTRQETGAGYYGTMELTGSLREQTVGVGTIASRSFTGLHGDGEVDASGDANVSYWPGINGNSVLTTANGVYGGATGVTAAAGAGNKFGASGYSITQGYTSDRTQVGENLDNLRAVYLSIRLARTAP